MIRQEQLQPGDVLLYKPSGIFGHIIALKTWHGLAHCEVALSEASSVASRDGKGVGLYPHRAKDLAHVLRPCRPIDMAAAMRWFESVEGQPYGWFDLLAFIGVTKDGPGMVCSSFVTQFLRAGGLQIFRDEPANKIAPFQFVTSELLEPVQPADRESAA